MHVPSVDAFGTHALHYKPVEYQGSPCCAPKLSERTLECESAQALRVSNINDPVIDVLAAEMRISSSGLLHCVRTVVMRRASVHVSFVFAWVGFIARTIRSSIGAFSTLMKVTKAITDACENERM